LSIRNQLATIPRSDVAISTITKAELFYGSAKSQRSQESLNHQREFLDTIYTIPFDDISAIRYGELWAYLEKNGTPIGGNDMLIASTALAYQRIMITHNVREFGRIPNFKIEDWETD